MRIESATSLNPAPIWSTCTKADIAVVEGMSSAINLIGSGILSIGQEMPDRKNSGNPITTKKNTTPSRSLNTCDSSKSI
jgi:hypothetical protein